MAPGTREQPHSQRPSSPDEPDLPQLTRHLAHRTVALFLILTGAVAFAYGWLQPALQSPGERRLAYVGFAALLALVSAAGIGLLRPALQRVRRGLTRRETAYRKLLDQAEDRARQLEQRNADLQRFATVVAHDLREPARTVSTHARLVQRQLDGDLPRQARRDLEVADQAARRLDRMLAGLLEYTTLEPRAREPDPVDAGQALQEALNRLSARLRETGAVVETGPMPTVLADAGELVTVFEHLVSNAIKFVPDDRTPRVTVTAEQAGDEGLFEIADNGIGVAPEHTDRVFAIFERLHTWDAYEGTGVGLALCRRIVERHGGQITVESDPGEGSTFRFTLPLADPATHGDRPAADEADARFEELV